MDTNTLNVLISALAAAHAPASNSNSVQIVGAVLSALIPTLAAVAAYIAARASQVNSAKVAVDIADAKKLGMDNAAALKEVHIAVNSGATVVKTELSEATKTILAISKELAALKESARAQTVKDAVAVAKSELVSEKR